MGKRQFTPSGALIPETLSKKNRHACPRITYGINLGEHPECLENTGFPARCDRVEPTRFHGNDFQSIDDERMYCETGLPIR